MNSKIIAKLLIITIVPVFILFLNSCVNSDPDTIDPVIEPPAKKTKELTKENLLGTWELYYFTKQTIVEDRNINKTYRHTEYDGFSITFNEDDTYVEKNVFGNPVTKDGKFHVGSKADGTSNDSLYLEFYEDSLDARVMNVIFIPELYEESFEYYDAYEGIVQGHHFKIKDVRYYRHTEKGTDYIAEDPNIEEKVDISEENLSNVRWQFYKHQRRIDQNWNVLDPNKVSTLGSQLMFVRGVDSLYFFEFTPDDYHVAEKKGTVVIVDDVIQMRWSGYVEKENEDGELEIKHVVEGYKYWLKDGIFKSSDGTDMFDDYDRYRDPKDALKEIEYYDSHKKVNTPVKSVDHKIHDIPVKKVSSASQLLEPEKMVRIYPQR